MAINKGVHAGNFTHNAGNSRCLFYIGTEENQGRIFFDSNLYFVQQKTPENTKFMLLTETNEEKNCHLLLNLQSRNHHK